MPADGKWRILGAMRAIKYYVYKEAPYYVAQCLNVDVSSFGETQDEAVRNLREAVELHFEAEPNAEFRTVDDVVLGEEVISA